MELFGFHFFFILYLTTTKQQTRKDDFIFISFSVSSLEALDGLFSSNEPVSRIYSVSKALVVEARHLHSVGHHVGPEEEVPEAESNIIVIVLRNTNRIASVPSDGLKEHG